MRQALTLAAAALVAAACGNSKGDQRVDQGGAFDAPQPGAGGNVNGRGMNDSNAARPADSSGVGAPSSAGIGTDQPLTDKAPATGGGVQGGSTTGAAGGTGSTGGVPPRP